MRIDLTTYRTISETSYHGATSRSLVIGESRVVVVVVVNMVANHRFPFWDIFKTNTHFVSQVYNWTEYGCIHKDKTKFLSILVWIAETARRY